MRLYLLTGETVARMNAMLFTDLVANDTSNRTDNRANHDILPCV
jgi:hypothetical protein